MRLDWYNENAHRAYPFILDPVLGAAVLPKGCVLDAGFWIGPAAGAVSEVDIYLASVTRVSDTVTFVFQSQALPDLSFTFTRDIAALSGQLSYAEGALLGTTDPQVGTAFLVTGSLADIVLGSVTSIGQVEPSCVQVDTLAYVSAVHVANDPDPKFGEQTELPESGATPIVIPRGTLVGDVVFKPGYNAVIQLSAAGNKLMFGAAVGAGAGEPCGYVWRGSSSSSLGCGCRDMFYQINGQGPDDRNDFKLYGGDGVSIIPNATYNRVEKAHSILVLIDYQAILQGCVVT